MNKSNMQLQIDNLKVRLKREKELNEELINAIKEKQASIWSLEKKVDSLSYLIDLNIDGEKKQNEINLEKELIYKEIIDNLVKLIK